MSANSSAVIALEAIGDELEDSELELETSEEELSVPVETSLDDELETSEEELLVPVDTSLEDEVVLLPALVDTLGVELVLFVLELLVLGVPHALKVVRTNKLYS